MLNAGRTLRIVTINQIRAEILVVIISIVDVQIYFYAMLRRRKGINFFLTDSKEINCNNILTA